ncbi:C40 family peptidase [Paenibacillus sp. N3.4]|uniref:C40 family peptidase n=1 Tax=Paenibacillus sp. N3.4 TaxID=2603222 RepID=UPI0011CAD4CA|nr:C40 family peptidase [Paenibacillus sp. N3.4]TXK67365.1 NlpC/P60 family protein [Paenibacillus sp. N3.4]
MAALSKFQITIFLSQKDFFENIRRTFKNKTLILKNSIRYLALDDVLEILEYDLKGGNARFLFATDGSEFVSIPRKGGTARREGVNFQIDPLIIDQGKLYLSLRSINRLFNVDLFADLVKRRVFVRQPAIFFITFRGDTFRVLTELLNTTVKKLTDANPQLKEPISANTRIRIPTTQPNSPRSQGKPGKSIVKIKQTEKAPAIIRLGRSLLGTPYRFGAGPYPRSGRFDCSSYLQYIFGKNGVALPRTTRAQSKVGNRIPQNAIEFGDVIFFRSPRYSDNRIGHCGVDIGNGLMLNTYKSPPGVTITRWKSPYWLSRYITAREIL